MTVHVFGIRHHGPGSARSLLRALTALQPDAVLVEGPPDAQAILPLALHEQMEPPVALIVYPREQPRRAVFYPFARFSPEWQALRWGLARGVPTRFIDLPVARRLALDDAARPNETQPTDDGEAPPEARAPAAPSDAVALLARAAGFEDVERWWERLVEQRREDDGVFAAILELMAAARETDPAARDDAQRGDEAGAAATAALLEARREAFMRQAIRAAEREGCRRIAVVCGAWHAPLLDLGGSDSVRLPDARADAALLEGLPALNVQAAWTPWTHGRLLAASGYGAGIASPGWYDHLWSTPDQIVVRWLARVARLLRAEGLDVSAAYLIEAARLAEALATLRGQPLPGLLELNDACRAVLAAGDDTPLRLIQEKLIVGEALGAVPEEAPTVPLQQDLQREQKRLRLPPEATQRLLELDLRQPAARERSELLHRLDLLGIDWGSREAVRGAAGTFHEPWRLQWRPELAVAVVEAAVWGNTVADAASARAGDLVAHSTDLAALLAVLDRCLAAGLPDAVRAAVARVEELAALSGDVERLLEALPPLANILRYGSVRRLDTALVGGVIDGIVPRIGIGLPGACTALNDESAATMRERIAAATRAIAVLQRADHEAAWHAALLRLADQAGMHGLIAGHCCRTLLDARRLQGDEAARRLGLALSPGNEPSHAAAWVQGFLEGSGLLLLHDEALWRVLDRWVTALPGEAFVQVLPLLRRTFSTFAPPERQRLGERVRGADPAAGAAAFPFDEERAASVVPLLARLLGVPLEGQA